MDIVATRGRVRFLPSLELQNFPYGGLCALDALGEYCFASSERRKKNARVWNGGEHPVVVRHRGRQLGP